MTFSQSLTLGASTLIFSACGPLGEKEAAEEAPAPAPEPIAAPEPDAIVETPLIQELGFAEPNTTAKLITQEETKTIVGEIPKQQPAEDPDDNVIHVTTPSLPDAQLPDDSSN